MLLLQLLLALLLLPRRKKSQRRKKLTLLMVVWTCLVAEAEVEEIGSVQQSIARAREAEAEASRASGTVAGWRSEV